MDNLFSLRYGIGGICVLLTAHILLKVAEVLWNIRIKKEALTESTVVDLTKAVRANTEAMRHLDMRMQALEKMAGDFPQLKTDVRRAYAAIKEIAGDEWPRIRDEVMKDGFIL